MVEWGVLVDKSTVISVIDSDGNMLNIGKISFNSYSNILIIEVKEVADYER